MRYFFDVPVYRLAAEKYHRQREAHIARVLFPDASQNSETTQALSRTTQDRHAVTRDHLERSYGGCWQFNEIVGYIRLYFDDSQVLGAYYGVARKRIVRTRRRTLEYMTWKLAPEVDVPEPPTRDGVLGAVREYLRDCAKELPGRYIHTEMLEAIAGHIDWLALFLEPRLAHPSG